MPSGTKKRRRRPADVLRQLEQKQAELEEQVRTMRAQNARLQQSGEVLQAQATGLQECIALLQLVSTCTTEEELLSALPHIRMENGQQLQWVTSQRILEWVRASKTGKLPPLTHESGLVQLRREPHYQQVCGMDVSCLKKLDATYMHKQYIVLVDQAAHYQLFPNATAWQGLCERFVELVRLMLASVAVRPDLLGEDLAPELTAPMEQVVQAVAGMDLQPHQIERLMQLWNQFCAASLQVDADLTTEVRKLSAHSRLPSSALDSLSGSSEMLAQAEKTATKARASLQRQSCMLYAALRTLHSIVTPTQCLGLYVRVYPHVCTHEHFFTALGHLLHKSGRVPGVPLLPSALPLATHAGMRT